jgi:hypothetical protein
MIEFTRIPYAKARRRARRQDRIVEGVVAVIVGIAVWSAAAVLAWWLLGNPS